MSKVEDLIPIREAAKRVRLTRSKVRTFAIATGTLHKLTRKIVWPEFERKFMEQREPKPVTERPRRAVNGEGNPLVKC